MAFDGEAIRGVFTLVNENPAPTPITLDVLASNYDTCCQDDLIRVFAEPTNDEFKNDRTTVIKTFSNAVTSVIITLQEYVNGSWNDVATLTDNTYGTFFAYGFLPNTSAFTIDWNAIHNAGGLGNGVYRLEFEATYFAGTYTVYSDNYCLTTYNASSVDGTVKIEWRMNGTFADLTNDKRFVDFGTQNLYFSLRLEGIFGKPRSEKEEEFIKYQNGQEAFVRSEQTPEYDLILKPQTSDILRILQYYVYQQDSILITDYNRNNHYNWVQKDVKITSGFAPEWDWKSKKASVNLTLTNAYNNFKRRL